MLSILDSLKAPRFPKSLIILPVNRLTCPTKRTDLALHR